MIMSVCMPTVTLCPQAHMPPFASRSCSRCVLLRAHLSLFLRNFCANLLIGCLLVHSESAGSWRWAHACQLWQMSFFLLFSGIAILRPRIQVFSGFSFSRDFSAEPEDASSAFFGIFQPEDAISAVLPDSRTIVGIVKKMYRKFEFFGEPLNDNSNGKKHTHGQFWTWGMPRTGERYATNEQLCVGDTMLYINLYAPIVSPHITQSLTQSLTHKSATKSAISQPQNQP